MRAARVSLLLVPALATTACAGGTVAGRASPSCRLSAGDSVYLAGGPVYRNCQVSRRAELSRGSVANEFRPLPSPGTRCLEAEVEMVVGMDGRPEDGTWRLVRATDRSFGDAVLESVSGWRYTPALLDGQPVR